MVKNLPGLFAVIWPTIFSLSERLEKPRGKLEIKVSIFYDKTYASSSISLGELGWDACLLTLF